MSGYWDNVEDHKRRQKRLRRLLLLKYVVYIAIVVAIVASFNIEEPQFANDGGGRQTNPAKPKTPPAALPQAPEPAPAARRNEYLPIVDPSEVGALRPANLADKPSPTSPSEPVGKAPFVAEQHRGEEDLRRLRESIASLGPLEAIAACARFRDEWPDLASPDVLAQLVTKVGSAAWLHLAATEAERVSPSSDALGAVWLPIAEAWDYVGDPAEAREAMRQAYAATPRMLSTQQQFAWFVDLYREGLLERVQSTAMLEDAIARTSELTDKFERRGMQAQLAGLASALGQDAVARQLLAQVTDGELDKKPRERVDDYVFLKWRAWAASWHASPAAIEPLALQLERLNYRRMPQIGNVYAYAAMAAARERDDKQFYRMALRSEAAFSQTDTRADDSYPHIARLVEAYLRMGKWRHALVAGNNLTDPNLAASTNLRILANAPQEVRVTDLRRLVAAYAGDRYAPRGVASYVEHELRNGADPIELAQWTETLEQPALRSSGYAGFARVAASVATPTPRSGDKASPFPPGLDSPRSLVEEAERLAAALDDPLAAAAAFIETARVWSLTNRQRSYDTAVQAATGGCLDAWAALWRQRPAASQSYKGTYNSSDSGRRRRELGTITRLLQTQRLLAQMQADLGDADGALDTCLHLAATASSVNSLDSDLTEWHYAQIAALLTRTEHETGVGAEAIASRWKVRRPFSRAMTAAWLGDTTAAKSLLPAIAQDSHDKGHVARVHAELATYYARRGDLDAYRSERRTAYRESQQRHAAAYVNNALAIADAVAGEYALAEDTLTSGTPKWSDGASQAQAEAARGLARRGDWRAAQQAAEKIDIAHAGYRCGAFAAVAHARYQDAATRGELIEWAGDLGKPTDRIGALCGLALAADGVGVP